MNPFFYLSGFEVGLSYFQPKGMCASQEFINKSVGMFKVKNQIGFWFMEVCSDCFGVGILEKEISVSGIFTKDLSLPYSKRTELIAWQRQLLPPGVL